MKWKKTNHKRTKKEDVGKRKFGGYRNIHPKNIRRKSTQNKVNK